VETIVIENTRIDLLPEKAIFWREESSLIIADLHLGKASHFRKNGLAVPRMVETNNLWKLSGLFNKYGPARVYFLGDLFHSRHNFAWEEFVDFRRNFDQMEMILIKGNHDILDLRAYEAADIKVVESLVLAPFILTHDSTESEFFNLHGHVHPCVRLRGKGRQSARVPCFFFADKFGILPSFGDFTGGHPLKPSRGERVFLPVEGEVISV